MKPVLVLAGAYNLLWGALVVVFPLAPFRWLGIAEPLYPELWQCIGMIVGVYGVGYWIASTDPNRHWAIVLVGLLGKTLGPIGFFFAAQNGRLPWEAAWTIVTNDLIWWIPFLLILRSAFQAHVGLERQASPEIQRMALQAKTQRGVSLYDLSTETPVMLVFLRHYGCTFCREALADLANRRQAIEALGTRIALIHMGAAPHADRFFRNYGLADLPRVSDPNRNIYRAFGLGRGDFLKLFGPKVWVRGFQAAIFGGHRFGRLVGDGFQMPGIFLLFHGEVVRSYRHQSAADRPDYMNLADVQQFPA